MNWDNTTQSRLNAIRDRIQTFQVTGKTVSPDDIIRVLCILEAMLQEMQAIDKAANFREQ